MTQGKLVCADCYCIQASTNPFASQDISILHHCKHTLSRADNRKRGTEVLLALVPHRHIALICYSQQIVLSNYQYITQNRAV